MKFFSVVLFLLLVFDGLKGLTLPQERPDKGLNTTLLANFSGLYVRRNPCSNEQMEASSYEASHEFHHHTKGSNWTEYTNKCSLLISNFLKSISNLIKFNNKHDGTFTFHVNTSISQKQADQHNCKGQKYSLPTIVIEATNCANSEDKKPEDKGLTEGGPKREVVNGLFGKQKRRRDSKKAFGELSSISQESSTFSSTIREGTGADRSVTEEPLTIFETTQIAETENYSPKNTNSDNLKRRQESKSASGEISNEYVTETPCTTPTNTEEAMVSQTGWIDGLILGSTEKPNLGNESPFRNSKFEMKPTRRLETTTNRGLFSPDSHQQSFNGVRKKASNFILPISSVTQQPRNPLNNRGSQFFLTTVSPITRSEKIETTEEITEYDSEQPENLNEENLQTGSFNSNVNPNVHPVQSAESSDYLDKEAEFSIPNIPMSATSFSEYLPITVRFEQEKFTTESPSEKRQSQTLQQSDILPNTPLTSEASSGTSNIGLGLQNPLDAAQPRSENLLGQRLQSTESLIESNEKAQLGITTQGSLLPRLGQYEEETINQFQSSEQSDQTYIRNSETVVDNNQNFSEAPGYADMEISPSREVLQPEIVLNEESAQPLDYLPTTRKPIPTSYDEKITENLNFKPGRHVADQNADISKQQKSFNRSPVTEPTTDAVPVTYSPQRKDVSSLEKEIVTTESSLRKVSQVKPNFFPSQTPNYGSPPPSQENRLVPKSSIASADIVKYDYSDSLSSASSTKWPEPTVSGSDGQIISQEPVADYFDIPLEQSPGDMTDPEPPLNDFSQDSRTIPYSRSKSETVATVYESGSQSYSQQNQQSVAPSTGIYEPHSISAPRPVELNIPVEHFQYNGKRLLPSENYIPKAAFLNYGTNNGKNIDSFSTNYPTTVPPELQTETELDNVNQDPTKFSANQLPVNSLSRQNLFSEGVVKTTEEINSSAESEQFSVKPLDYEAPSSLPKFQQPFGTSTNIQQFPVITQPHSRNSEEFSETTFDSSDVYSQQTSSITVPVSGSQEAAANVDRNSLPNVNSESENVSASEESYYLNQNDASTFSEQRQYDDTVSSQDARTQIPQPQPSLDYPDQLLSSERESNIASANLKTSKTFEGSEPNFQPLLTYTPSPSIPSKTQTFTTEAYESDDVADEYRLPSRLQPEAVGSTALEAAETSSSSFSQLSSVQNTEIVDTTELPKDYSTPTYNGQFIPITPTPSLTAAEKPPFVKADLPAYKTYSAPEAFVQKIPVTPRPQFTNSAKFDQEIVTSDSQQTPSPSPAALLPMNYPDQLLNNKKEQGFVGGNLAVTEHLEDRLERSDIKATTSQVVLKNSNRGLRDERVIQKSNSNQDIVASSTALIENKFDASSQQLQGQRVTLPLLNKGINNLPKTGAYPNNLGLASSAVGPVHAKATFDEEVITTDNPDSLSISPTQAPPVGYSQKPDEQFEGQRHYFQSSTSPQPSRQFYPGNRPIYHPPQGFPPQSQFENRPYGNYPHPMDFNPQAPRPRLGHFDNFAGEQRNQFPTSFQNNQFESRFPSRFHPGLDPRKDRFTFSGQASNYGNRYLPPNERPNFSYTPSSRSGVDPESLSSPSQVPPNFFSFQRPNAFEERDSQYQSYRGENFNTQLTAPPYAQNYEPYSYYSREDFGERFGPNYPSFGPESRDRFHPDQIPYNQMMPPFRNHPGGDFNPHVSSFLNNSNQQIDDRYQQHTFDPRVDTIKGVKTQETEKIDMNQASPEVLADYKKALTEMPSGERLVKFDEEVITISPEKEFSSEATVVTEKHGQRQDAASYNFRNQGSGLIPITGSMGVPPQQAQQGNLAFREQNRPLDFPLPGSSSSQSHPLPFSQSVDSFGQQQASSLPNFSNQFRSASSDFQQQSNANFANPQKPNGGNEVGPNPSQSDSYALGPDQISPSRKPDPASSRRSNVPSPYRNPVARPIAGPETFSSG